MKRRSSIVPFRTNVSVQVDVLLNKSLDRNQPYAGGAFLASNVDHGGCDTTNAQGVHLWTSAESRVARLTSDAGMTTGFRFIIRTNRLTSCHTFRQTDTHSVNFRAVSQSNPHV
jgi:hypothetical protein